MDIVMDIANSLRLDANYLSNIINRSEHYYRCYQIPKKTGGFRLIFHPSPELKTLQHWVSRNIFSYFPTSKYAYAYKTGTSIKKLAYCHIDARHILRLDIKNFFESINTSHIRYIIAKYENELKLNNILLNENDIETICKICLYNNGLKIGAVSSPIISNIVMNEFDIEMSQYLKSLNPLLIYSRYADDIYISSTNFIDPIRPIIRKIKTLLKTMGFILNEKKTFLRSDKYKIQVTGLIVKRDGQISVGTELKKKIKGLVYKKLKYGIGDSSQIIGYLMYLKDIEPQTYTEYILKYTKYSVSKNVLYDIKTNKSINEPEEDIEVAT